MGNNESISIRRISAVNRKWRIERSIYQIIVLALLLLVLVLLYYIYKNQIVRNINEAEVMIQETDKQSSVSNGGDSSVSLSYSGKLPDSLSDEEKLAYIMQHSELYLPSMLEQVEKYPQTLDYVYEYPRKKNHVSEIELSEEAGSDTVPLLLQWDSRWGYRPYGDGLIGYTGCGPTCLSMVAIYLTGNARYSPDYVAELAERNGYWVDDVGTTWDLMCSGCRDLGLTSNEIPLDEDAMASALMEGQPIICSVKPGDFTYSGHFIVLTGYKDGMFTVNDPNSRQNSEWKWSYTELSGQIKNMWAFSSVS